MEIIQLTIFFSELADLRNFDLNEPYNMAPFKAKETYTLPEKDALFYNARL
jgi:hypothetical protein